VVNLNIILNQAQLLVIIIYFHLIDLSRWIVCVAVQIASSQLDSLQNSLCVVLAGAL